MTETQLPSPDKKSVGDLSSQEIRGVSLLCAATLKRYFGDSILSWTETTFHSIPAADGELTSDDLGAVQLEDPITLPSVIVSQAQQSKEMARELKAELGRFEGQHEGRYYSVAMGDVVVVTSRSGDKLEMGVQSVTIVPHYVYTGGAM